MKTNQYYLLAQHANMSSIDYYIATIDIGSGTFKNSQQLSSVVCNTGFPQHFFYYNGMGYMALFDEDGSYHFGTVNPATGLCTTSPINMPGVVTGWSFDGSQYLYSFVAQDNGGGWIYRVDITSFTSEVVVDLPHWVLSSLEIDSSTVSFPNRNRQ